MPEYQLTEYDHESIALKVALQLTENQKLLEKQAANRTSSKSTSSGKRPRTVGRTITDLHAAVTSFAAFVTFVSGVTIALYVFKTDVSRIERVQHYQIEQSAWHGKVLMHLAEQKQGPVPGRSIKLQDMEKELIRK